MGASFLMYSHPPSRHGRVLSLDPYAGSYLRSVLVELGSPGGGDPHTGRLLADACDRSFCYKGVQRIRQGSIWEPGQRCSLQILERNPGLAVLRIKRFESLQNCDALQRVWSRCPWSHVSSTSCRSW